MSAYPYTICYKDQYNQNFDVITAVSFDGSFDQVSSYTAVEGVTSDRYDGIKIDYGARHIEQAEVMITLVKKDYSYFSNAEKRAILRWLSSNKQCSWLKLYDQELEEIVEFYGRFSSVDEKISDANVMGFVATFTSPFPWGFSPLRDVRQTFTSTETIIVENDTDDPESLVRPYITIAPTSAISKLTITNETTNRQTIIKNIKAGETITIDNENKLVFSDDVYRVIGSDMYGIVDDDYVTDYPVWIEFCEGDNKLVFDTNSEGGTVSYIIQYRYPVKIGSTF